MEVAVVLTLVLAVLTARAGAAAVPDASSTPAAATLTPVTEATTVAAVPIVPLEPLGEDKSSKVPTAPVAPAVPPAPAPDKKMAPLVVAPGNSSISVQERAPLLAPCSVDAECVSKHGQHSACRDYWCACVDGAAYDSAFSKRCLLSRTGLGESCKENGDCRVANTYCKGGSCHCSAGFVFSEDGRRCLPVATQADPSCTEAQQCAILLNSGVGPAGAAVCLEGRCRCRYDHQFSNGTCVLKKARGMACSNDMQCVDLAGGSCIQGVCGCKDGTVPAVAANKCLPVLRSLGAPCEEPIQCSEGLGDLGLCRAGACSCADGARLAEDNKCQCEEGHRRAAGDGTRCERPLLAGEAQGETEAEAEAGAAKVAQRQQGGGGGAAAFQSSALIMVISSVSVWALHRGL